MNNEDDAYIDFIKILREKEKNIKQKKGTQQHHIWPIHDGGPQDGELVRCSIADHAQAHQIRYEVYGQSFDKISALLIRGQNEEARELLQEKIISINRERKNVMFNPEWQKIQANKPKSRFFLRDNKDLAKIFSKMAAKITTSPKTKEILGGLTVWTHKAGSMVSVVGCEDWSELEDLLNDKVPGSIPPGRASDLGNSMRNGLLRARHGWMCIEKVISSEIEGGKK